MTQPTIPPGTIPPGPMPGHPSTGGFDPAPSRFRPDFSQRVSSSRHEGDEVPIGHRQDIDPERPELHPMHGLLFSPYRQPLGGADLDYPSGEADHESRIRQAAARRKLSMLDRAVLVGLGLKVFQDRFAL